MKINWIWCAAVPLVLTAALGTGRPVAGDEGGKSGGTERAQRRPFDWTLYQRAARVLIGGNGNPEFRLMGRAYPCAGRPTITAATFEPGVILEITPEPDRLQAEGITVEDLREACFYRRFAPGDRTVEILELKSSGTIRGGSVTARPKKTIDLTKVAAIHAVKMQTRPILYRFNEGGGLRIVPHVDKIAPYLITIDDFELQVNTFASFVHNPAVIADPAKMPAQAFFLLNEVTLQEPGKYIILEGLRIPDGRLPHYFIKYDPKGQPSFPAKAEIPLLPGEVLVQTSLGVPLESVARVEVVPVRTSHGVVIDPFLEKPEDDFIVQAAAILEAVQAQVRTDAVLKPLVHGKRTPEWTPTPLRVLGCSNRATWIGLRADTPDVFYQHNGPPQVKHAPDRGWLSITFDEGRAPLGPGMAKTPFMPPLGSSNGDTSLSVLGTQGTVAITTLTRDPRAHRRLVDLVMAESAKLGWTLKPDADSRLDSWTSGQPSPVLSLPPGARAIVTPR